METECTIWWVARSFIGQNKMSWTGLQFLRLKKISFETTQQKMTKPLKKILYFFSENRITTCILQSLVSALILM